MKRSMVRSLVRLGRAGQNAKDVLVARGSKLEGFDRIERDGIIEAIETLDARVTAALGRHDREEEDKR